MSSGTGSQGAYDLVVVGGNSGGLSVAIAAQEGGLGRVRILEPTSAVAYTELIGEHQLDVGFGETVERSISPATTSDRHHQGRLPHPGLRGGPPHQRRELATGRRRSTPPSPTGSRSTASRAARRPGRAHRRQHRPRRRADRQGGAAGARVVLAAGGMTPTASPPSARRELRRLERERLATILFRSVPDRITEEDGLPLACFGDRRTPDLEFDKVIFASGRTPSAPRTSG